VLPGGKSGGKLVFRFPRLCGILPTCPRHPRN